MVRSHQEETHSLSNQGIGLTSALGTGSKLGGTHVLSDHAIGLTSALGTGSKLGGTH